MSFQYFLLVSIENMHSSINAGTVLTNKNRNWEFKYIVLSLCMHAKFDSKHRRLSHQFSTAVIKLYIC